MSQQCYLKHFHNEHVTTFLLNKNKNFNALVICSYLKLEKYA